MSSHSMYLAGGLIKAHRIKAIYKLFMVLCDMCVVCVRYIVCGMCVVCAWYVCGMCVVCVWYVCGMCVVCVWYVCGIYLCVECAWYVHGMCVVCARRGICVWYVRGMCVVCVWYVCGICVLCVWYVRGICAWFTSQWDHRACWVSNSPCTLHYRAVGAVRGVVGGVTAYLLITFG